MFFVFSVIFSPSSITFTISLYILAELIFNSNNILIAIQSFSFKIPTKRCSVPIKLYPNFLASIKAFSNTFLVLGVKSVTLSIGCSCPINSSIFLATVSPKTSSLCNTLPATPFCSFTKPYSKCSVPT